MITKVDNIQSVGIGFKYPTEFFGLSTDTKPTDTANGSVFTEIDSGKKYMFDFAGGLWCEIPAAESGGGGDTPSGGGVLVVHESVSEGVATLDKTYQEIVDAGFASLISSIGSDENPGYCVYVLYYYGGTADDGFEIEFTGDGTLAYTAASANDYPSREQSQ